MSTANLILHALLEDMEPTGQWPEDFKTILFDYLEQRFGISDLPPSLYVKEVPAALFLKQARSMRYASGDTRARPEYLSDLRGYLEKGGKMPPLIVDGSKLLDGRHRLLAQPAVSNVQVIDLVDQEMLRESVNATGFKTGYHAAPGSSVQSIMRNGLIPACERRGMHANDQRCAIYFFDTLDTAEDGLVNWLVDYWDESETEAVIFSASLPSSEIEPDPEVSGAFRVFKPVPPDRLKIAARWPL